MLYTAQIVVQLGSPGASAVQAVASFAFQLSRPIFFLAMYLWSWGPQVCVTVWGSLEDGKGLIQLLLVACLLTQQGPDVLKFYTVLCQLLFVRGSKNQAGQPAASFY